jgi:hypothetical protein
MTRQVPDAGIIPVAIRYEHSMHERPEAFIRFLEPVDTGDEAHHVISHALATPINPAEYRVLMRGRKDANETWNFGRNSD